MTASLGIKSDPSFVDDPVLSERETADYCGIAEVSLRRMRKAGKIPYIQISENRIGYRRSMANRILDSRTVQPTAHS
jgi:predicted site-specific integrase-resolvase